MVPTEQQLQTALRMLNDEDWVKSLTGNGNGERASNDSDGGQLAGQPGEHFNGRPNGSSGASCSAFIQVYTDLELPEFEARNALEEVVRIRNRMAQSLGREVDIRVAMMDYFTSVRPMISSPKLLEFSSYLAQRRLSVIDDLTGLYNRRFMRETLDREMKRSRRYHMKLSIVFLDIDNFKQINDRYGHAVGDTVLRTVAGAIRKYLRSEDVASRFGGEEFLVLMPHTGVSGAASFALRLLRAVQRLKPAKDLSVTFSAGIACYPDDAATQDELLEAADALLYQAKEEGKDRVCTSRGNRRADERQAFEVPLVVRGPNGELDAAVALDISAGGLCLQTSYKLTVGERLSLSMQFRSGERLLQAQCTVIWVGAQDDRGLRECGVQFDPQPEGVHGFLRKVRQRQRS